jgi:hypothetical protein
VTQRPLPLNADLALWLRLGFLREVGYTHSGVMSYALTPTGRALLANRLACEAEDDPPIHA